MQDQLEDLISHQAWHHQAALKARIVPLIDLDCIDCLRLARVKAVLLQVFEEPQITLRVKAA